jgi:cytochrome c-type biogenesis protein CcmE
LRPFPQQLPSGDIGGKLQDRNMSDLDEQLRAALRESESAAGEPAAGEPSSAPNAAAPNAAAPNAASAATDPVVAESRVAAPATDRDESDRKRNLGLLLGLLAVGGAALSLVLGGSTEDLKYSRTVEQVLANEQGDKGKVLTVEGRLVHGSLLKRDQPCEYRFKLRSKENSSGELQVRYPVCIVPDNFRDVAGIDVDVSATGRIAGGVLTADNISTKCPTKYEMEQQAKLGVKAPHAPGSASGLDLPGEPAPAKSPVSLDD